VHDNSANGTRHDRPQPSTFLPPNEPDDRADGPARTGVAARPEQSWQATEASSRELDAELPHPLSEVVIAATEALRRKPLRDRIKNYL
jgi:hypothetical protein